MSVRIDLQAHTTASDGTLTPSELVELARARGIDVLAITDHDTLGGVAEAVETGAGAGLRIVPGVELSACRGDTNVHVLGLFCSLGPSPLQDELAAMREHRLARARAMVDRLGELGYAIGFDDVLRQAGGGVVGRPHVARALVAAGHVSDVASAFTAELIADGGRADVAKRVLDPVEAVRLVGTAGGVAVLAHPARSGLSDELVAELARAGLAGLEADHPDHSPRERERLRLLAGNLGLVATGGSDFHAPGEGLPGSCTTAPEELRRLEALARGA